MVTGSFLCCISYMEHVGDVRYLASKHAYFLPHALWTVVVFHDRRGVRLVFTCIALTERCTLSPYNLLHSPKMLFCFWKVGRDIGAFCVPLRKTLFDTLRARA